MKHKTPKSKQAEWERGWIERNRLLKSLGLSKITLEQYVAELHGTVVTQPKEFRTKLTIDNTEKTSTTAATAPVISDGILADDAEITIDIDPVGDGTANGLKLTLIGTRA